MPYASLSAARIVDDDAGDSRRRGVRREKSRERRKKGRRWRGVGLLARESV